MLLNTDAELFVVFVSYMYLSEVWPCFSTGLCPSLGDEEAVWAAVGALRCSARHRSKWH